MTDKKLTDNEIKKALKVCCTERICRKCVYFGKKEFCIADNTTAVLDLINRLQAKVEHYKKSRDKYQDDVMYLSKQCDELQAENERLKPFEAKIAEFNSHIRVENMLVFASSLGEWLEFCDNLKAEARKEFAKELHYKAMRPEDICDEFAIGCNALDNLLKEMESANND